MSKKRAIKQNPKKTVPLKNGIAKRVNLLPYMYGMIVLFAFLLYGNTIPNRYSLDDDFVILENKAVHQGIKGIPEIFTSRYVENKEATFGYRPVTKATLAIEYQFFGENPQVSHLINILLYALTGLLLFSLMKKFLRKYSLHLPFIITLLFMAHPLHTEVVASIKNREEILSFLGGLLFLHFSVRFMEVRKIIFFVLAVLSFIFGIMSKLSVLPFILIVPLCIYYFYGEEMMPAFARHSLTLLTDKWAGFRRSLVKLPAELRRKSSVIASDKDEILPSEPIHHSTVEKKPLPETHLSNNLQLFFRNAAFNILNYIKTNIFILAIASAALSSFISGFDFNYLYNLAYILFIFHYYNKSRTTESAGIRKLLTGFWLPLIIFFILALPFTGLISFGTKSEIINIPLRLTMITFILAASFILWRRNRFIFLKETLSSAAMARTLMIFAAAGTIFLIIFFLVFRPPTTIMAGQFLIAVIFLLLLLSGVIISAFRKKLPIREYLKSKRYHIINIYFYIYFVYLYNFLDFFSLEKVHQQYIYSHLILNRSFLFITSGIITWVIICRKEILNSLSCLLKLIGINLIIKPLHAMSSFVISRSKAVQEKFARNKKNAGVIGRWFLLINKTGFKNLYAAGSFIYDSIKALFRNVPGIYLRIALLIAVVTAGVWAVSYYSAKHLPKENARLYQWQNPLFKEKVVEVQKPPKPAGLIKQESKTQETEKTVITVTNNSLPQKVISLAVSFGFYFKRLLLPYPLLFYYGYNMFPYDSLTDIPIILSLLILSALLFLAFYGIRRKSLFSFSVFYFIITISMFLNFASPVTGIVGERLVYIASLGFSVFTGYSFFLLAGNRRFKLSARKRDILQYALCFIILIPYVFITVRRNKDWTDLTTLVEKDIPLLSRSAMANVIYASIMQGKFYQGRNRNNPDISYADKAIKHYKQALAVYPYFHNSWNNIGTIYSDVYGRFAESIPYFHNALRYKPDYAEAFFNLAYNYERINKTDSAFYFYEKVLQIDSGNMKGISYMANLYFATGDTSRAFLWNKKIMGMDSLSDIPYINIGNYYFHLNRIPDAIASWEKAFQKKPANYGLCMNLGTYYSQTGNKMKADFYYRQADMAKNK